MKIAFANKSLASFILFINIYFVYESFDIIKREGGPMGIALIALPVILSVNIFIVPAVITFSKNNTKSKFLLFLNSIGTILIIGLIYLFTNISRLN